MEKGYVQIYTGNGKGKSTAALGVALRTLGAGGRVYYGQFMKSGETSEIKALRRFEPAVYIDRYGNGKEIAQPDMDADSAAAINGFQKAKAALSCGRYDVVILDELNVALHLGYLKIQEVLDMIHNKPAGTELILTGRYAKPEIMEAADLVTEMTLVKHYFNAGVQARVGIEK